MLIPRKPSRDPGDQIKAYLRREVNFGCPVRYIDGSGCGSPILTFHHFDPPWAACYEHHQEGMIALCPQHHLQADAGFWTNIQLQAFKRHPYVDNRLKVRWPWQTETMLIKVGRSIVLGGGSALRLDGIPVVKFVRADIPTLGIQTALLTSHVRDHQRRPWLTIEDGWFDLRLEQTVDAKFSAQTKAIFAKHSDDTFISLRFRRPTMQAFRKWVPSFWSDAPSVDGVLRSIERAGAVDSDGHVPLVEFEGRFTTNKVSINVRRHDMIFESLIPGMREQFSFKSHLVDDKHRMLLKMANGPEFFSLG